MRDTIRQLTDCRTSHVVLFSLKLAPNLIFLNKFLFLKKVLNIIIIFCLIAETLLKLMVINTNTLSVFSQFWEVFLIFFHSSFTVNIFNASWEEKIINF
jgi:hypothetical protein